MRRTAAVYAFVVGVSMLGMWGMFYATGSIPELETEPARIAFHLAAEFLTAIGLLIAGWGLWKSRPWADRAFLLAMGALFYTMIQSPGYFLQTGDLAMVGMFAVLILVGVAILVHRYQRR